ncbi:C2H2-type zinc finger protein [Anaerocolumna aminovalerica]|uniref:C2H2-type zinc finger protein n=1 Tax=Anaerocolumna aminovalerica TaxID=1527 RepID=UPI001C0EB1E3|nr:C2H2-type zinc finger protein [Anaerocolumna aminovalerica]MBU5333607.1 C2H2-type zinc finger protein [Anaerocolumna aminovalerica]
MKIRNCTICNQEFESKNGRLVCSDECAYIRKQKHNREANYRRYNGLSNTLEDRVCPVCGKRFQSLRRKYCTDECSHIGRTLIRKENFEEYYKVNREDIIKRVIDNKKKREKPQKINL